MYFVYIYCRRKWRERTFWKAPVKNGKERKGGADDLQLMELIDRHRNERERFTYQV